MMRYLNFLLLGSFILISLAIQAQHRSDTIPESTRSYLLGQIDIYGQPIMYSIKKESLASDYRYSIVHQLVRVPSVAFIFSGSRNESSVSIQGFDLRSIPVFIDGIPVSATYDGYMDLSRINVGALEKIEISKGFSSILHGVNATGGTINLVTPKPEHRIELTAAGYIGSGEEYNGHLSLGQKFRKIYYQVGYSKSDKEYVTLSENFETRNLQQTRKLDNSWQKNGTFNAKFGYTPNGNNEFSVAYYNIDGEKGNPIYLGADKNIKVRYWQWPEWKKEGVRFITKSQFQFGFTLRANAYYDRLANTLKSYDDNTYTTQKKGSSFTSFYRDENYGGAVELTKMIYKSHELKFAGQLKKENHRENNIGEPIKHFTDHTFSGGIEDQFYINNRWSLLGGISFNFRDGIKAEEYNSKTKEINDYPNNSDNSLNYQVAGIYKFRGVVTTLTFAKKSRFATMKDRYSYRNGIAMPNIDLKSEVAYKSELSFDWAPLQFIHLKSSIFYHKLNNTIQHVDEVMPGIAQMQNTGESYFFGGDLTVEIYPTKRLSILTSYSYLKRKNTSNPELRFTDIPEGRITSGIDFEPLKSLHTFLNIEYNAASYSTSYGTRNPDFIVLDINIKYLTPFGLGIEAGINNLFDLNYTRTEGYYESGRTLHFSLSYNFNTKE